jgi:hypothetical protein
VLGLELGQTELLSLLIVFIVFDALNRNTPATPLQHLFNTHAKCV